MTVKKNITLSDNVARWIERRLEKEPWRNGNFSGLVNELLHKQLSESSESLEEEEKK